MKNAVILFISILCTVGCHSASGSGGNLFVKTAGYLTPLMPDKQTEKTTAETSEDAHNAVDLLEQKVPPRPSEYHTTARHPLYKPGSILPSHALVDDQFFAGLSVTSSAETNEQSTLDENSAATDSPSKVTPKLELKPETLDEPSKSNDVLQARKDDSQAFRELLGDVVAVPKDEWNVNESELAELFETFRNSMNWEDEPELELRYLAALRRKILPAKKSAKVREEVLDNDDDGEELAEPEPTTYQARTRKNKTKDKTDDTAESFNTPEGNVSLNDTSAHLPPKPVNPTNTAPQHTAQAVYPVIPQLPGVQPVLPTSYAVPTQPAVAQQYGADWESTARIAVEQLRQKITQTPTGKTFGNEAKLRLLELILNNRNEAAKMFPSEEKPLNEFWANQMLGLAALLDDTGTLDSPIRYAGAAFRFDEGLMELRKICPIKLRNVRFVRDVQAFGFYLPRSEDCRADETVDVYMELENPTVRRTGQGYNVAVSMSYEIRDATGNVLEKVDNISVDCTTPGPKRDHFVNLRVALPKNLQTGSYQLRINVTDTNDESLDYTEEQIPFKIVPSADAPADGRPGAKPPSGFGRPGAKPVSETSASQIP